MSWFKKELPRYDVGDSPLTDEEKKNPYHGMVFGEFEEVVIDLDELLKEEEEEADGESDQPTDVPSG